MTLLSALGAYWNEYGNLMLGAGISTIRAHKSKCAMRNAHVTAA